MARHGSQRRDEASRPPRSGALQEAADVGGGWGGAPKFPSSGGIGLLLRAHKSTGDLELLFFGLQGGVHQKDIQAFGAGGLVHDVGRGIFDFAEAATALSQLDLLISIDAPVAHLAAAMGVKTWVLLPATADWRWQLGGADGFAGLLVAHEVEGGVGGVGDRAVDDELNVEAAGAAGRTTVVRTDEADMSDEDDEDDEDEEQADEDFDHGEDTNKHNEEGKRAANMGAVSGLASGMSGAGRDFWPGSVVVHARICQGVRGGVSY